MNTTGGLAGPDHHLDNLPSNRRCWPCPPATTAPSSPSTPTCTRTLSLGSSGIFTNFEVRSTAEADPLADRIRHLARTPTAGDITVDPPTADSTSAVTGLLEPGARSLQVAPAGHRVRLGVRPGRQRRHARTLLRQRRGEGLRHLRARSSRRARHRPGAGQLPRPRRHRPRQPRQQLGPLRHGAQHRAGSATCTTTPATRSSSTSASGGPARCWTGCRGWW